MNKKKPERKGQVPKGIQTELWYCDLPSSPSLDPYARGASTTGDYCSVASCLMTDNTEYKTVSGYTEYQIATGNMEYHTGTSTNAKTKLPVLSFGDNRPKPLASGTQGKITMESSLSLKTEEEETPKGDTPKQALAEAITTRMPEGAIAIAVLQAIDDVEPSEVKTHLVLGNSFFLGF